VKSGSPIPSTLLKDSEGRAIAVLYSDGHIQLTEPSNTKPIGVFRRPFPGEITLSVLSGNSIVGTWIEREIGIGRMASMDLAEEFEDGIELADLRIWWSSRTLPIPHVAGAMWSKAIDRLPLSLTACSGQIVFSLEGSGIYAIDHLGGEIWRTPLPRWEKLSGIPNGSDIVAGTASSSTSRLWSAGGGWIDIDLEGEVVAKGVHKLPTRLIGAWGNNEVGWVLSCDDGVIHSLTPDGSHTEIESSGRIHDAIHVNGVWWVAAWRSIIQISADEVKSDAVQDLPIGICVDESNSIHILDNTGKWDKREALL